MRDLDIQKSSRQMSGLFMKAELQRRSSVSGQDSMSQYDIGYLKLQSTCRHPCQNEAINSSMFLTQESSIVVVRRWTEKRRFRALCGKLILAVFYFKFRHALLLISVSLLPTTQPRSMPSLFYIVLSPILLFVSIPLSLFAALTTTLAFSTLFLRALLVYAELGAVLVQNQFINQRANEKNIASERLTTAATDGKPARRSSAGSGSTTPRTPDTGLGIYSGSGVVRDFEGVGGWRTEDEDAIWMSLNSRLELPAMVDAPRRNHHRSRTSGSLTTVSLPLKSPVRSRARTPTSARVAESVSSEEYFTNPAPS